MRIRAILAGYTLLVLPLLAAAQAWPSKTVKLIVPFPASGTTDMVGREAANILRAALGQAVVVENRAGGNGTVGLEVLAKSASAVRRACRRLW